MKPESFCQSCTMPIDDPADRGSEKDGSSSTDYCKYCYQNGVFTDPDLTLDKMKATINAEMKKQHLPNDILQKSLAMLPYLKRWQKKVIS